jgi:hypothetical protein
MLVWVASYPRSGNTFLRILLTRLYGVRTSVIYDFDGVAERVGPELVGFTERPAPLAQMRADDEIHFVKTHRRRDADVDERDRAIILVRDGRDSVVSWARLESEKPGRDFRAEAERMITVDNGTGAGGWGRNVLSWLRPAAPHRVLLRYEDLIADPSGEVGRVVGTLAPQLPLIAEARPPAFAELQQADRGFFRRGQPGSHRDELPEDLRRTFHSQPENDEALHLLGYLP